MDGVSTCGASSKRVLAYYELKGVYSKRAAQCRLLVRTDTARTLPHVAE